MQDAAGELLDGTRSGTSGTDYHGEIVDKDLVTKKIISQVARERRVKVKGNTVELPGKSRPVAIPHSLPSLREVGGGVVQS